MKAHWWTCVLGLLCMPAEVILNIQTVQQNPLSVSYKTVNSSAEIVCSTSLPDQMGLYLHRNFHGQRDTVFLSLKDGLVTKNTTAAEFAGRIHINPDQQVKEGHRFTFQLSLLEVDDTDLYYCEWSNYQSQMATLLTNATIIIVKEKDPQEQCGDHIFGPILIFFSVMVFTVVLLFFIVMLLGCKKFKKNFVPARTVRPTRSNRPHHQRDQYHPYLVTSVDTLHFQGTP
uniref:uncharacterized protein LOC109974909 n=1 Tax=Monopterus albus TaxID=43700 RepID=UPI0009B4AC53|nr:uncharacterized protein LOC109974909 [Monopterus albus]XP_020481023.1 uncharacterized protein LOC109974909 [Monopterus albus]